jgi:hypothetical protein
MPSGYVGSYGGGVNVCGLVNGKSTLFNYVVHPAGGAVTATIDPGPRVELYGGFHWDPFGPERTNPFILMRIGPVFSENKISVTSNQAGAGGRLDSASNSSWTTGLFTELGLSSPLCSDCMFGQPLRWTLSGKAYWFGSGPSVNVPSSTFTFTETVSIKSSSEYGVQVGLSTPIKF